jgi:hypothetical protein
VAWVLVCCGDSMKSTPAAAEVNAIANTMAAA